MKRSTDRILTTHTGSIARPDGLIEMMRRKQTGDGFDDDAFQALATAMTGIPVARRSLPFAREQGGFTSFQPTIRRTRTAPADFKVLIIGAGMALIVIPTGRVIRSAVRPSELPAAFAAQFSLSHMAWLLTYPIAGWVGTAAGFTWAWSLLAALAITGAVGAVLLWPATTQQAPAPPPPPGGIDRPLKKEAVAQEATLTATQCSCARPV